MSHNSSCVFSTAANKSRTTSNTIAQNLTFYPVQHFHLKHQQGYIFYVNEIILNQHLANELGMIINIALTSCINRGEIPNLRI